jgi:NADH-ubiquinone oxidoreductase chain 6
MVLNFGDSFLGLIIFLICLGGMMVVFGYTIVIAIEDYPETWGSNVIIWGVLMLDLLVELIFLVLLVMYDEVDVVVEVYKTGVG